MKMSDMLYRTKIIYKYIKTKKQSVTLMQVEPTQKFVERHIERLGFQFKGAGAKDCIILLDQKKTD